MVIARGTPTRHHPGSRPWMALGVVLVAAFMDNVDATIATVALPRIQTALRADDATAQWVLAGYTLSFGLLLITGGRLGDIVGRKRVFLLGLAGFVLASVGCAAAGSPAALVAGRVAQGALAALMVPQVMSVIVALFGPAQRVAAFSLLGAVLSLGSVSGPLLGGLLTEYDVLGLGWRAIFAINVPVGIACLGAAAWMMPETRSERPLRLDIVGVVLVTLAALAILVPLVQGRAQGWPGWMFAVLGAAVPVVLVLAAHQRRHHRRTGSALLPPPLLRQRSFTVGVLIALLVFSGISALFLVLTYQLQAGLGWSPLRTGLVTLAWPVGITATSHVALRSGEHRRPALIGTGAVVMASGTLAMIALVHGLGAHLSWPPVAAAELAIGVGMGLCVPILTGTALHAVEPQDAGAASGLLNTGLQIGTTLGIAIAGTVFFTLTEIPGEHIARLHAATATTLWYTVAAFAFAALLSPLLSDAPRTACLNT